ncbi:MAG: TolC family protein [Immundisolibacteraceae bacterium]|nr:TolC family protein [Immundisolibacteraceae bacterium]
MSFKRLTPASALVGLVLIAWVIAAAGAHATDLSADQTTISLRKAVLNTIASNPDLRAFDYQLQAQQGRVQQAGLAPSPELSFELEDFLGSGDNKGMDSAQATLSIGWVLERGVRQRYVNAARAGGSLVEVEAGLKRFNAAAETAGFYLLSLAYQAREASADKTVQLAEQTIKAVGRRVEAGKTPAAELSRAEAELALRKLQRKALEYKRLSANRQLAAQWGATQPGFNRVEGDIMKLPRLASFKTLKTRLSQNPEFARLLSDQLLKKAELDLVLAQSRPSWRISAGIRHDNSIDDQAFVTGITIPFGKQSRNPGRITEARANLASTASQQQATRIRIETALFVSHETLLHGLHVIAVLREQVIPPLEQALTETRRAYDRGRYSYLELRSVELELLKVQQQLVEASIDVHRNVIEIERLTGVGIVQPPAGPASLNQ